MLSRSHARGNDRRAIAADVIGAAIAAEERPNVRRRMVVSGRGRRIYHFERNTGHIKSYLDAICRWPVEDVLYRTLVSGRYGSMPAAGRFGGKNAHRDVAAGPIAGVLPPPGEIDPAARGQRRGIEHRDVEAKAGVAGRRVGERQPAVAAP